MDAIWHERKTEWFKGMLLTIMKQKLLKFEIRHFFFAMSENVFLVKSEKLMRLWILFIILRKVK